MTESAWRREAGLASTRAERLDAIINTTVDGIIVIDPKGTIEAFNRGAERMFGYPESEVVGRNVSVLMPSPQHEEHDAYLERYLTTGAAKIIGIGREVIGPASRWQHFPLHLSVGEMRIGGAPQVHRDAARSDQPRAARRPVAGQRSALARSHRFSRRTASS